MKPISRLLLCLTALTMVFSATCISGHAAYLGTAAPILAEDVCVIRTALYGEKIIFKDTDFKEALGTARLDSITVTELPSSTEGTLLLNGRRVKEGQTIQRRNIGALIFLPASSDVKEADFTFTAEGYAGGAALTCRCRFVDTVNYAPTLESATKKDVAVSTQSGVGFFGTMAGSDPEGDVCSYMVISYPKHGTLTLTNAKEGAYKYTPVSSFVGQDSFSYVVRDEYGNYSTVGTVSMTVTKRLCGAVYVDMEDRAEYNAALALTAIGAVSGESVNDRLYFRPDATLTRAEFTVMALKAAGIRQDSTLTATYFDDNDDIPEAYLGYVATAQKIGVINGSFENDRLCFRPNDSITLCEAAVILSNLTDMTGISAEAIAEVSSDVPFYAKSSVACLLAKGAFTFSTDGAWKEPISRAQAAVMVYKTVQP